MTEITLSTLGDLLDHGYCFDLWCPRCERGSTVPIEPFVAKLGRGHGLSVSHVVRCKECGQKGIEVRLRGPAPKVAG